MRLLINIKAESSLILFNTPKLLENLEAAYPTTIMFTTIKTKAANTCERNGHVTYRYFFIFFSSLFVSVKN